MPRNKTLADKPLTGILRKPSVLPPVPIHPTSVISLLEPESIKKYDEELALWKGNAVLEMATGDLKKLQLLLEHCAIDSKSPTCWLQLSLILARECIPGFRHELPKIRGREKSDHMIFLRLYKDVDVEKRKIASKVPARSITNRDALKSLKKQKLWDKYAIKTLENMLAEAEKSPLLRLIRNIEPIPAFAHVAQEFWKDVMPSSIK